MRDLQLLVQYPEGGAHYVARWYTDADRGHVIVARRLQSLESAVYRVTAEHRGQLRFDYAAEVCIVAPPANLDAQVAKMQRDQTVGSFHWSVCWEVRKVLWAGLEVPGFRICPRYKGPRGKCDNKHTYCTQCSSRVVCDLTPEALYEQYYDAWHREVEPSKVTPTLERTGQRSRAAVPKSGDRLHCLACDFNHHGLGVYVTEASPNTSLRSDVLFYYVQVRELSAQSWNEQCESLHTAYRERDRLRDTERKERQEQADRAHVAAVQRFFAGRTA